MTFPVVQHHPLNTKLVQPFRHGWHTDEASAKLGHKIDRLGRGLFGGHDQVALVFAIGIIDHDDHLAARDVAQNRLDGVKLACGFFCRHFPDPRKATRAWPSGRELRRFFGEMLGLELALGHARDSDFGRLS